MTFFAAGMGPVFQNESGGAAPELPAPPELVSPPLPFAPTAVLAPPALVVAPEAPVAPAFVVPPERVPLDVVPPADAELAAPPEDVMPVALPEPDAVAGVPADPASSGSFDERPPELDEQATQSTRAALAFRRTDGSVFNDMRPRGRCTPYPGPSAIHPSS